MFILFFSAKDRETHMVSKMAKRSLSVSQLSFQSSLILYLLVLDNMSWFDIKVLDSSDSLCLLKSFLKFFNSEAVHFRHVFGSASNKVALVVVVTDI